MTGRFVGVSMAKHRLLYLHRRHFGLDGPDAMMGKLLYEALKTDLDAAVTSHMIIPDSVSEGLPQSILDDVITQSEFHRSGVNVVYLEGGLDSHCLTGFDGSDWKMSAPMIEEFARRGGIVVVADLDINIAQSIDEDRFGRLFKAWFRREDGRQGNPIEIVDPGRCENSYWSEIWVDCEAARTHCAEWLQPIYNGLSTILVGGPLELGNSQSWLANIVSHTMGTMCQDCWWEPPETGFDTHRLRYHPQSPMGGGSFGPFASVCQLGRGYLVAIAARVSSDYVTKKSHGNIEWIINIIRHLRSAVENHERLGSIARFRGACLFLSHRSVDKPVVEAISDNLFKTGISTWLDKERMLPSDSLGLSLNAGLTESSHFTIFWSRHCKDAPWVHFELGSAISACIERRKPILVVALDDTPPPDSLAQFIRINGKGTPQETSRLIYDALAALVDRESLNRVKEAAAVEQTDVGDAIAGEKLNRRASTEVVGPFRRRRRKPR
ncbi:toll/interleukin-1 receptor domain-containing protein [Caballeronia cordobensis]|uniref:toll/interleukin-1 receptor domain-containing protein n=1 Tax=Caballeronia cordobensis TaxID=1353886 RepID=UPI001E4504AE